MSNIEYVQVKNFNINTLSHPDMDLSLDNNVSRRSRRRTHRMVNTVSDETIKYQVIPTSSMRRITLEFKNAFALHTGPNPETIPIPFSLFTREMHDRVPFSESNSEMMRIMKSGKKITFWADECSDDDE